MTQDILEPKDERDLAEERDVKPLKSPGGVSRPPSVPTMGAPETGGTPAPPPSPVQGEMGGVTGTQPQPQQQTPSQMVDTMASDLMFATPSFQTSGRLAQLSGEEVRLQADPLEVIDERIQGQLGQLTPESMYQKLQRSSYTPQLQTELPNDWNDKQDIVDRAIGDIKVKNMNITQAHQYGFNPNNIGRYGVSNAPALDTDLASRGLSSELSKAIEDKLALERTLEDGEGGGLGWNTLLTGQGIPVVGGIGGLWRDVSRSVLGIGLGAGGWIEERMPDWYKNNVRAVRKKLGIDDDLERITREQVEHLQSQTAPQQKFDPTKGRYGDYGTGGTGAALYLLNVIPSAVMGGVYDLVDLGRELAGSDEIYGGSRTLAAFAKGKDWGLSNQWSEQKYLSLQEPEDLTPGQMTGNWYWDLPEQLSKVTGMNVRAAHWLVQAPLAIAGEALIDIPADRIAAKIGGILPSKIKTPAQKVAEEAFEESGKLAVRPRTDWTIPEQAITPEVLGGEIVKVMPTNVKPDEFVRTEVVKPRNAPEQILYVTPNGKVRTTIKDENGFLRTRLPNGFPSTSDIVNTNPKTIVKVTDNPWEDAIKLGDYPLSAVQVTRRSDAELTELAKLMPSPFYKTNRPLLPPGSRVPSANELKALELSIPEFKRYGANTELVPSGVYEPSPPALLPKRVMALESVEDAMLRRSNDLIDAVQRGDVKDITDAYRQLEISQAQLAVLKAKHLDDMTLYDAIKKDLPTSLQTDNLDLYDEAQVMLQSDFNITVLGNRKRQIEGEISLLQDKIQELDSQLNVLGNIGRGDYELHKRTSDWSSDDLVTDNLDYEVVEVEPGQKLVENTDRQNPEEIDFGTPQRDAEMMVDEVTQPKMKSYDDFDPLFGMEDDVADDVPRDDVPFGMEDEDPYAGFYGTDDEVDDFADEVVDVPEQPVDEEFDTLTFDEPTPEPTPQPTPEPTPQPVQASTSVDPDLDSVTTQLAQETDNWIPASELGRRMGVEKDELWKRLFKMQRNDEIEIAVLSDINPNLTDEDLSWVYGTGTGQQNTGLFYVQMNKKLDDVDNVDDIIDDLDFDFGDDIKDDLITLGDDDMDDISPDFDPLKIPDSEITREMIGEKGGDFFTEEAFDAMEYIRQKGFTADEDWNYIIDEVHRNLKDNNNRWSAEKWRSFLQYEEPVGTYDADLYAALTNLPDGTPPEKVVDTIISVPNPPEYADYLEDVRKNVAADLAKEEIGREERRALTRERGRKILGKYADYVNIKDEMYMNPKFDPFMKRVIRPTLESIEELTGGWIPKIDITSIRDRSSFNPQGYFAEGIERQIPAPPNSYIGSVNFGIYEGWVAEGKWDNLKAQLYHEIGHAYEYAHPKYLEWATDYRQSLIDQGLVIDASEYAYEQQDQWSGFQWLTTGSDYPNPYVARTYRNGSTEVISTIFEYFSDRDTALYFKKKNPSLYKLGEKIFSDAQGKPFNINDVYPAPKGAAALGRGHYETPDAIATGLREKTKISTKYFVKDETLLQKTWYHGTPSPNVLSELDYSMGGSTSELGFGLYLSPNVTVAQKSATKFPMPNQPYMYGKADNVFGYRPTVYEVNLGMYQKVLDLNQPVPKGNFRKMFEDAAYFATGDKSFSPHALDGVTKFAYAWNKFRENYYKYFGKSASEGVVRKYYQHIYKTFDNWGIEAGYFKNNGVETMVVYKPQNVIDSEMPHNLMTPMAQANVTEYRLAAQQYLDSIVLRQFGDDVSKVNWLSSNKDLAEWLKRQHQRSLAEVQADLVDEITLNMNAEEALRYGVEDEVNKTIESFVDNLEPRTVQEYNINQAKIAESPCPPMTPTFFK